MSGQPTAFDASASTATCGDIAAYRWDYGDGTVETTSTPTASHVYATPGTYAVTLTVTDSAGTSTTKAFTGQAMAAQRWSLRPRSRRRSRSRRDRSRRRTSPAELSRRMSTVTVTSEPTMDSRGAVDGEAEDVVPRVVPDDVERASIGRRSRDVELCVQDAVLLVERTRDDLAAGRAPRPSRPG